MGGLMIIGLRLSGDWWSYYQDISIQSIQFQHVPAVHYSLKIFWATAVVGDHPPESSPKHDSFALYPYIYFSVSLFLQATHAYLLPYWSIDEGPKQIITNFKPVMKLQVKPSWFFAGILSNKNQQLKLKFETKKDQANRCHSVYKKPGVGPQMSATFLPHPFWLDYW